MPVGPGLPRRRRGDGRRDRRPHRARRGVSAPSYAHGVVDPVAEIAAAAAARGVRCHVDACIGGWVLPYAARLGRAVPPWTFAVEGVTSISVDLHKYAYAPKGTSLLLHRDAGAAAAAVLRVRRLAGLHDAQRDHAVDEVRRAARRRVGGGAAARRRRATCALTRRRVRGGRPDRGGRRATCRRSRSPYRPDSTLVALATDATCDAFTVCDEMVARGLVRPAADVVRRAAADDPPVGERRRPSRTSTSSWRRSATSVAAAAGAPGRSRSTRAWSAFIEALDPAALSRRGLRRAARGVRAGRRGPPTAGSRCRADGRGQRDARRGLAGDARGAAGGVPRPAAAAGSGVSSGPERHTRTRRRHCLHFSAVEWPRCAGITGSPVIATEPQPGPSNASSKNAMTRCSYSSGWAARPPMWPGAGDLPDVLRLTRGLVERRVRSSPGLAVLAVHEEHRAGRDVARRCR